MLLQCDDGAMQMTFGNLSAEPRRMLRKLPRTMLLPSQVRTVLMADWNATLPYDAVYDTAVGVPSSTKAAHAKIVDRVTAPWTLLKLDEPTRHQGTKCSIIDTTYSSSLPTQLSDLNFGMDSVWIFADLIAKASNHIPMRFTCDAKCTGTRCTTYTSALCAWRSFSQTMATLSFCRLTTSSRPSASGFVLL